MPKDSRPNDDGLTVDVVKLMAASVTMSHAPHTDKLVLGVPMDLGGQDKVVLPVDCSEIRKGQAQLLTPEGIPSLVSSPEARADLMNISTELNVKMAMTCGPAKPKPGM